jgi:hypothetical protein
MIAWSAIAAAGIALDVMVLSGFGRPQVSPVYTGPPVVAWAYLAQSAGYLTAGAVMARIVTGAARTPARQVAVSPAVRP